MQFKVPQFIEVENKILGPLTFKQALYVGGSLGISYVLLKILPTFIAIIFIVLVLIFGWALAFLPKRKYGKPFIEIVEAGFKYIVKTRLYTWKRSIPKQKKASTENIEQASIFSVPKISGNKLGNISKNLEVGGIEKKAGINN